LKTTDLQPRQLLTALLACDAVLAAIYFASLHIGGEGVHPLFDLDGEGNIPVWFSSIQLFGISLLLALCGPAKLSPLGVPPVVPLLGATVFLFLSMDETSQVHERVGRALRSLDVPLLPRVRADRGMWVSVYLLASVPFLALALRYFPALWQACRTTVIAGMVGCGLIAVGAAGVELIADEFFRDYADVRYLYLLSVLAEETLEMLGGSVILYGAFHLRFRTPQPVARPAPVHGALPARAA
jgi:hypothetical protein